MSNLPKLQAAAADIIRFAFPHIRAQAEAKGGKPAAFYFRFVADFYAAAPDGISQEDIDVLCQGDDSKKTSTGKTGLCRTRCGLVKRRNTTCPCSRPIPTAITGWTGKACCTAWAMN